MGGGRGGEKVRGRGGERGGGRNQTHAYLPTRPRHPSPSLPTTPPRPSEEHRSTALIRAAASDELVLVDHLLDLIRVSGGEQGDIERAINTESSEGHTALTRWGRRRRRGGGGEEKRVGVEAMTRCCTRSCTPHPVTPHYHTSPRRALPHHATPRRTAPRPAAPHAATHRPAHQPSLPSLPSPSPSQGVRSRPHADSECSGESRC